MMYAKSADEFVLNYKQFEQQANSKESEYLKKNWLNCKEKWVLYYRRDHANTNNHVESINGQLKRHQAQQQTRRLFQWPFRIHGRCQLQFTVSRLHQSVIL